MRGIERMIGGLRRHPDASLCGLIVLFVLAANLPYLLDFFDPNPLGPRSGLATLVPGLFPGGNTVDPNNGYVSQALGHRAVLDLLHGHLPWWDPYEGVGVPLAGELQSAAFFPPTWLLALSNGQLYEQILLEAVAGIATYLLLRRLTVSRPAALAGGVAYALNGTFALYAHAPVNPIAFLPLLLLGLECAYCAAVQGRRGSWWVITVAIALSLYAGFPETAYLDGLLALLWLTWRCGRAGRRAYLPLLRKAAAGGLSGVLLAAPILLAFLDAFQHSSTGTQPALAGTLHLPTLALPQLLLPYVYGPFSAFSDPGGILLGIWGRLGGYLTVSLMALALVGLLSPRRRALKLVLVLWLTLALARMYGLPLIGEVLGVLPGMSAIFFFRYAFPAVELAVIVLAVLGIDDLRAGAAGGVRRVVSATAAALATILVLAIEAHGLVVKLSGGASRGHWAWASLIWGATAVLACGIVMLLRSVRLRSLLLPALVVLDAIAMFTVHELSAPRAVHLDLAPVSFLRQHVGLGRFFTLGPIQPQYGAYFGIASINDDDDPVPSAWTSYVKTQLDPVPDPLMFVGNSGGARSPSAPSPAQELLTHLAAYRATGVRYVLTPAAEPLPRRAPALRLVARSPTTRIYELGGAAPYFEAADNPCVIHARTRAALSLSCPTTAVLIRRELYFPGWHASVDGHPAHVRRVQGIYQGLDVGPGAHVITFTYAPPGLEWSLLAFVAGAGWLILGVLKGRPVSGSG